MKKIKILFIFLIFFSNSTYSAIEYDSNNKCHVTLRNNSLEFSGRYKHYFSGWNSFWGNDGYKWIDYWNSSPMYLYQQKYKRDYRQLRQGEYFKIISPCEKNDSECTILYCGNKSIKDACSSISKSDWDGCKEFIKPNEHIYNDKNFCDVYAKSRLTDIPIYSARKYEGNDFKSYYYWDEDPIKTQIETNKVKINERIEGNFYKKTAAPNVFSFCGDKETERNCGSNYYFYDCKQYFLDIPIDNIYENNNICHHYLRYEKNLNKLEKSLLHEYWNAPPFTLFKKKNLVTYKDIKENDYYEEIEPCNKKNKEDCPVLSCGDDTTYKKCSSDFYWGDCKKKTIFRDGNRIYNQNNKCHRYLRFEENIQPKPSPNYEYWDLPPLQIIFNQNKKKFRDIKENQYFKEITPCTEENKENCDVFYCGNENVKNQCGSDSVWAGCQERIIEKEPIPLICEVGMCMHSDDEDHDNAKDKKYCKRIVSNFMNSNFKGIDKITYNIGYKGKLKKLLKECPYFSEGTIDDIITNFFKKEKKDLDFNDSYSLNFNSDSSNNDDIQKRDLKKPYSYNPTFLLKKGTFISCTLVNELITSLSGELTCITADDVYSENGQIVLIDKGSKILGTYKRADIKIGQNRLYVIWDTIKTPFDLTISLNADAIDELGASGLDGWVDNHWIKRFGGAVFVSLINDSFNVLSKGLTNGNKVPATTKTANSIALGMLESTINIKPTIYKNHGDTIGILINEDLDFSDVYDVELDY